MSHIITTVIQHGPSVKELHIRRMDGGPLPEWSAGSHIVLRFLSADGESFEERCSLIGMRGENHTYRVVVHYACREMTAGSQVDISRPRNNFPLRAVKTSARLLLIAQGLGIAAMISIANMLTAKGIAYSLHYLIQDPDQLILQEDLSAIPQFALHFYGPERLACDRLGEIVGPYQQGDVLYGGGPADLLDELTKVCIGYHWTAENIYFESSP